MTVAYLNPTARAMVQTLSTAFGIGVQPGRAVLKASDIPLGDVTAMIEIVSNRFHASLAIGFNEQSLLSFTQFLLHETHLELDETVVHIAGDVAVMIGGELKRQFSAIGQDLKLKHPTIIVGYEAKIKHRIPGPKVVFPINTEDGIVFLEVCVQTFASQSEDERKDYRAA